MIGEVAVSWIRGIGMRDAGSLTSTQVYGHPRTPAQETTFRAERWRYVGTPARGCAHVHLAEYVRRIQLANSSACILSRDAQCNGKDAGRDRHLEQG
jgi:hypothetical protein